MYTIISFKGMYYINLLSNCLLKHRGFFCLSAFPFFRWIWVVSVKPLLYDCSRESDSWPDALSNLRTKWQLIGMS